MNQSKTIMKGVRGVREEVSYVPYSRVKYKVEEIAFGGDPILRQHIYNNVCDRYKYIIDELKETIKEVVKDLSRL